MTDIHSNSNVSRRAVLQALAGLSVASIWPTNAAASTARTRWAPDALLSESFPDRMARHAVPGMAIAVIENGQLAWEAQYGVSNAQHGTPVTQQTLFQAASLTKPVFAYGVMKLIETGKLSLESRLADYLLPPGLTRSAWTKAITVRHVLTHTTGLPNWRDDANPGLEMEPKFEPGTGYSYSGEAYHWLQSVVETVTGTGIRDVLRRLLFEPAGLSDMEMLWTPERDAREVYGHGVSDRKEPVVQDSPLRQEHCPRLHAVARRWGRPVSSWNRHDFVDALGVIEPHTASPYASMSLQTLSLPGNAIVDAASSLRTTAGDYARFMTLMMDSPKGPKPWQISDSSRRSMLTPQHHRPDRPLLPPGLGWGLEKRDEGNLFHHWGKNGAAHISLALGDPQRFRGLVIMVNGAGLPPNGGSTLVEEVATALTGVPYACI